MPSSDWTNQKYSGRVGLMETGDRDLIGKLCLWAHKQRLGVTQYAEVNWGFKACDETEALKTGAHKLIERVYSGNEGCVREVDTSGGLGTDASLPSAVIPSL
ncbi:hypothetical protein PCH_Pc22g08200 [Penicillium rubens Wisconsin 54-1255]|uniref:Uncharacterized protein n=1 Tax=Penicillium rubens (strain ATCC 28089 / DSM 1075 / NRRL 1951 / Wisconsin 54-1255) TaxID=500485 RepID=B6HS86_PENRW|nr:hypothetical protein PCH_Pc22g08200 [Penicillium rubens Wisconsin 54-1255]